jgi:hypothetical protein
MSSPDTLTPALDISAAPMPSSAMRALVFVVIAVGALACISIVGWELYDEGPFWWHAAQPRFWQGGIEALVLIAAFSALHAWRRHGWRLLILALLAEIYSRRHAVDAAVLVDLIYLELIFALGSCVTRLCGGARPDDIVAYLRCFVLGFCTWSACTWTLSALGLGTQHDLRLLTFLLFMPALAARSRPWTVFVARRIDSMPVAARIAAGALIAWFLILFAHSATAVGYDGQWYGLRGDRVLVGAGSVFASQGLVAAVYYFPKVYELFLVPISGLGSTSVVVGMTIAILGLIAAACYELLRRIGVCDALPRLAAVGLVVSLPAVANIALEAKPDLLAVLLLLLAWIYAAIFIGTRKLSALVWFLALLVFSPQAKLTAIPFAAALFLATLIAFICSRSMREADAASDRRVAWIGLALIVIVSIFATARTLLLAGVPTIGPDPLFKLWRALGFELVFPVGTLQWGFTKDWADTPDLIIDLLFRPQRLLIIVITWVGNVWAWLAVVAGAAALAFKSPINSDSPAMNAWRWPGFGLALMGFAVMLCWGFGYRGGDGNYYIAGLIPAILFGMAAVWPRLAAQLSLRRTFLIAVCAFCLFQATYTFISTWWTGGTRAFDLDFSRKVRTLKHESKRIFAETGIARIDAQLRSLHRNSRIVACTEFIDTLGMRLPASVEDAVHIAISRPEFINTQAHFIDFLKADRIEYLLVPRVGNKATDCSVGHVLIDVAASLDDDPNVPALHDDGYTLYDIRRAWPK